MHTLVVITCGLVLLGVLGVGAALLNKSVAGAMLWFIALWFAGAALNMWVGVARAGYTVAQEFPIFLVVFGLPALAALVIRWRYKA